MHRMSAVTPTRGRSDVIKTFFKVIMARAMAKMPFFAL